MREGGVIFGGGTTALSLNMFTGEGGGEVIFGEELKLVTDELKSGLFCPRCNSKRLGAISGVLCIALTTIYKVYSFVSLFYCAVCVFIAS